MATCFNLGQNHLREEELKENSLKDQKIGKSPTIKEDPSIPPLKNNIAKFTQSSNVLPITINNAFGGCH